MAARNVFNETCPLSELMEEEEYLLQSIYMAESSFDKSHYVSSRVKSIQGSLCVDGNNETVSAFNRAN